MKLITPKFRVSFPNIFKPRRNELNGKDEFSLVALFEKGEDLKKLYDAANEVAEKKWGPDKKKWPKNLRLPFKDQADRAKDFEGKMTLPQGYTEGAIYLNLKSTNKPGVVNENAEPIIDQSEFYAGCYARASISVFAYDQAGNRGISFGLNNIQKMADGEHFGGKMKAEDEFAPLNKSVDATEEFFN